MKETLKIMEKGIKYFNLLILLPTNRTKLHKKLDISYPALDRRLNALERVNLVRKTEKGYVATSLSKSLFYHVNRFDSKRKKYE